MRRESWASVGSITAAAASSACCWLPLLMVATGFSIAGASALFERFRPIFLIFATILLGAGFYLNYRPHRDQCGPDGSCPAPNPRLNRVNRGMLWFSVVLVAALAMFPNYVGRILGAPESSAADARSTTLVLEVEGMTCAGCEVALEQTLGELPEVAAVDADYETSRATLQLVGEKEPGRMALTAAVAKAGYTLVTVDRPLGESPEVLPPPKKSSP